MHGRRKLKKHLVKINITELYELLSHYQPMDQIVLFQLNKKLIKLLGNKDALTLGIQLINPDIEVVKEALIQIHEKKKMEKEKAGATYKSENPSAEVDEMLATHKKMNDQMIKDKQWMKSSYNAPLEIHIQLIIFAYE